MKLQKVTRIRLNTFISYIHDKQAYLLWKFESIFIHLFLTNREIIVLRQLEQTTPDVISPGTSICWEYGSQNKQILDSFEFYNQSEPGKKPFFKTIYRFIHAIYKQIHFYFYLDELLMDGFLETDGTKLTSDRLPQGVRILFAPNSRIRTIYNWLNLEYSFKYQADLTADNYLANRNIGFNTNSSIFLKNLGNLFIPLRDINRYECTQKQIPLYISLFEYPIAYGVRE